MALTTNRSDALIARDHRVVSPAIYRYTDVAIARGEGVYVWDLDERRYIDFAAGIATLNVGHCHPRVVAAITEQAQTLIHAASHVGYMAPFVDLLEFVLGHAPAPLAEGQGVLVNSGGEAVEAAVKLARMVTGRQMVLAFTDSFHGRPMGALALTASNSGYRRHLESLLVGVEHVPYPYCFRCPFGHGSQSPATCCGTWKAFIESTFDKLLHPDDLAAVIVEPIVGEGGYVVPPPDFLPALRAICDRTGALLIADEVQTGLGRTGKWYATEHWGVVPDVVALGKAIGGGLPLGAVIARRELMAAWPPAAQGSTFGGNPLACRAGLESLRITEEAGLLKRAIEIGDRIQSRFRESGDAHVVDVRGIGLMIAVELAGRDGPMAPDRLKALVREIGDAGVLMTKCGQSALRIAPPLILSDDEADDAVNRILDVLQVSPQMRGG